MIPAWGNTAFYSQRPPLLESCLGPLLPNGKERVSEMGPDAFLRSLRATRALPDVRAPKCPIY